MHKSSFGGFFSIATMIVITMYLFIEIKAVLTRSNTSINYSTNRRDLSDPDNNSLNLTVDNFNWALKVQYIGTDPAVYQWFN